MLKPKKWAGFTTFLLQKHESMKANLSQKAMKLAPNDNYFTEEFIVNSIQVVYC